MPAKSAKQYRFMQAVAHGAINAGPSKKVAEEFIHKTPAKKRKEYSRKNG